MGSEQHHCHSGDGVTGKSMKIGVLLSFISALAWGALAEAGSAPAAVKATSSDESASGIEYRHLREAGPQSIHVVSFDLAGGNLAVAATVGSSVLGNETVPEMAARLPEALGRPVAAINGDYFQLNGEQRYLGTLQGMCVVEGEMVTSPPASAFWIDAKGAPRLGRVASRLAVIWPDGSETPFALNCSTLDFKSEVRAAGIVLYTPRFGRSTQTAQGTREWVLRRPAPNARWLPLSVGGAYAARVSEERLSGDSVIPPDGMVLSMANAVTRKTASVKVGDTITLRAACDPDMTGTRAAVSGSPTLLADGRLLTNPSVTDRAPRTAVGLAGGKVWFVVVDGRRPTTAVGMSLHELAELMKQLGCADALNLDGGGSSTLWFEGKVVNSPSDGSPRPVGNALILLRRP